MADADWPAPTRRSKQTSPIETAARYSPDTPNLIGGIREESQLNRDWCVTRRVVSKLADLTSATRSRAWKCEKHITLIELCHLVVLFYILLDFSWILFTPLELTLCLVRLQIYKFLYGLNIQEVNARVWRRTKQSIWKVMGTILRWKLNRRKTVFFFEGSLCGDKGYPRDLLSWRSLRYWGPCNAGHKREQTAAKDAVLLTSGSIGCV